MRLGSEVRHPDGRLGVVVRWGTSGRVLVSFSGFRQWVKERHLEVLRE